MANCSASGRSCGSAKSTNGRSRIFGDGRALISYQTPSTYVDARARYGIEPLVVPLAKGEPFYRSAIAVRADAGIGLARWPCAASASPSVTRWKSTGSKAMPESTLQEAGTGLRDLAQQGLVGSHDHVAKAVLAGDYDAGGLMPSVAEKYTGQGLKILATPDRIPQFPLCAGPALSPERRERVVGRAGQPQGQTDTRPARRARDRARAHRRHRLRRGARDAEASASAEALLLLRTLLAAFVAAFLATGFLPAFLFAAAFLAAGFGGLLGRADVLPAAGLALRTWSASTRRRLLGRLLGGQPCLRELHTGLDLP
ncbi:MAG: PhnD/SsuA/transferrin family substrate-binding protein [Chromatiales bacterium]|nr:PhnD/SsuA/transferrin family substrate-binding protein [Chromatiales bacterium]